MSFDQGNLWVMIIPSCMVSEDTGIFYTGPVCAQCSRLQLLYQLGEKTTCVSLC